MKIFLKRQLCFIAAAIISLSAVLGQQRQPSRPPVTGIAYVALQVSDLKQSFRFYRDLLGYTSHPDKAGVPGYVHAFMMPLNLRQSIVIQDGLPAAQDERMLSIAFETADAEGMRLYLQANGIEVPPSLHREMDGLRWFIVKDPDNHPIKFLQRATNVKVQAKLTDRRAISARLLHAGLTVVSVEKSNHFYKDLLGFAEIWRGGASDSITNWINMRVPDGTDYIEYMLVNGPVDRKQLGNLHHIALMVPDMQAALDVLNIRNGRIGYEIAAPRVGRNKRWQLNLFDPNGTRIELMEPFTMR